MTDKEIIEMAEQAGWDMGRDLSDGFGVRLEAFAKLIAEAEREAFKQIIRETPFSNWFQADLIEAIDKRGQA
jgi:hypothetical protein